MSTATHQPLHRPARSAWEQVVRAGGVLLAVFVVLAGVLAVLGLAVVHRHGGGPIQGWDNTVERWFWDHRAHMVTASKIIAKVLDAGPLGGIVAVITVILLLARLQIRALIPLAGYIGGEAFVYVTRLYMHRPRPSTANYPAPHAIAGVHETSWSFPSGHASGAAAVLVCLGGLAAVTWRMWWPWVIGVLAALAVAGSRLVLGVHWFSDIVFGLAVGVPWAIIATLVLARVEWPFSWLGRREPAEEDQGVRAFHLR
ncbi:MAG TPA: phosphatase PAP2 family protein [Acidimicrobiales bacterium]|nr:phosphatase PAP2 family protein [Acidimicrobiales bacterium]